MKRVPVPSRDQWFYRQLLEHPRRTLGAYWLILTAAIVGLDALVSLDFRTTAVVAPIVTAFMLNRQRKEILAAEAARPPRS